MLPMRPLDFCFKRCFNLLCRLNLNLVPFTYFGNLRGSRGDCLTPRHSRSVCVFFGLLLIFAYRLLDHLGDVRVLRMLRSQQPEVIMSTNFGAFFHVM